MNKSMVEQEVTVVNELGLHARAAAALVKHAGGFKSDIFIVLFLFTDKEVIIFCVFA